MFARQVRGLILLLVALSFTLIAAPAAQATRPVLRAKPTEIAFGEQVVGDTYYKRTKITVGGTAPVRVLVSAGLPDDFGFGFMPGSTCPVLNQGELMAPGESCYAVVRFTPTDFFVGWDAHGEMIVTATNPATGEQVGYLYLDVTGTAVL
jgi:hypothetical protein